MYFVLSKCIVDKPNNDSKNTKSIAILNRDKNRKKDCGLMIVPYTI